MLDGERFDAHACDRELVPRPDEAAPLERVGAQRRERLLARVDGPRAAIAQAGGVIGVCVRQKERLCVDAREPAAPVAAAVDEQHPAAVRHAEHAVAAMARR